MKKLLLFMVMVFVVGATALAQRTVNGRVTNDAEEPLIGASVLVKGTTTGTLTDNNGNFSLSVPETNNMLVISYVGFASQDVAIGDGSNLSVKLNSDLTLEEVVVTGLGIKKEKKALGYGVSTISSASIANRTEADIARIMRGKAPGVDITQTSGIAGSGTNIIIRGYSSINGTNQPLFVIDGVPFNTDANSDRNFVQGGATASSRFLDLDPNNVAEVSILKGLSATVLYGEAGRNGVILITTKNGNAGENSSKKSEISFTQSLSYTEISNLPSYQDSYGNGFSGNFGWFFSNWGPGFDVRGSNGIDENGQVQHPYDQAQFHDDFPEFRGVRYDYKPYPSVENFFQKGVVSNTSVNFDKNLGNSSAVSANYSYLSDEGFTPGNNFTKHNFGLGGKTKLDNGLTIRSSFNYVDSDRNAPPAAVGFGSNPSGASVFGNIMYTPRSIDLMNLPFQSPVDGSMVYYRRGAAIQNPRWTLANANDNEQLSRFYGNINLSYDLTDWLTANYRIGIDQYNQVQQRTINKGGSQVPDGAMYTSGRLNKITDQVMNFLYNFEINEKLSIDGIAGLNLRRETRDGDWTASNNQFIFDLFTHDNFINHQSGSFRTEENTVGAYLTSTVGYGGFAYLNIQARNDWTSTLEQANRSVFYPSASISFIPTEAIQGLKNNTILNYLKVRFGYGTSAGYPNPYQTRSFLNANTNVFVSRGGAVLNTNTVDNRLGNPNLRPETHTEIELGLEAKLLQNRIGIDLSLYDKQSDDIIIDLQLDPSTGYTNTTVNAASLSNRGIEFGLNLIPIQGAFTWSMDWNFTKNINIVNSIADGVDQVVIAGYSNLGNFAVPGEPYGIIQGTPYEKNENGDLLVGADGNYIDAQDIAPIGNPNPNYQANWINSFTYKGIGLNFQFTYIDGGDIYSNTTATLFARGNTIDTDVDRFIPVILPGVKASDGSVNDYQGYMGDFFFRSYFWADEGKIFDGTTLRLREVSLSYDLPAGLIEKTPFGAISLIVSGENMWYKAYNFPFGVNFDPEVLSLGVGNGRGFELLTGPTAKKYGATLRLTF